MRRAGSAFAYAPRAAVVSGQALAASAQQIIAASASGVGPAGRGALRLMEVAALVLAAALKAGNERLLTMAADKYARLFAHADAPAALALQLLHRHRVDPPLLAAPSPTRPLLPRRPPRSRGGLLHAPLPGARGRRLRPRHRHAGARTPPPAPPAPPRPRPLTEPQARPRRPSLPSYTSRTPLLPRLQRRRAAGGRLGDLFHELPSHASELPSHASRAMYRALLEVLGAPHRRPAPPGCTGAATGPPAPPSKHAAQPSHASAGKEL
eukprot:tig00021146_g19043.t2